MSPDAGLVGLTEPQPIVIHVPPYDGPLPVRTPAPVRAAMPTEKTATRKRAAALDALRGLFLISMTFGFTIAEGVQDYEGAVLSRGTINISWIQLVSATLNLVSERQAAVAFPCSSTAKLKEPGVWHTRSSPVSKDTRCIS